MNTLAHLCLLATLCLLAAGCATSEPPSNRLIQITANRVENNPAGFSAILATNIFYDLAAHLERANPMHIYPDQANPAWPEYAVSFTPVGASTIDLTLDIEPKHIIFRADAELDPASLAATEKAVSFYRQALDDRKIKYTLRSFDYAPEVEPASTSRPFQPPATRP
jgi:hypothetical protein